jgi:hypothetical protein
MPGLSTFTWTSLQVLGYFQRDREGAGQEGWGFESLSAEHSQAQSSKEVTKGPLAAAVRGRI